MAIAIIDSALVLNDPETRLSYTASPFSAAGGPDSCVVALVTATQGTGTLAVYPNTTATFGGQPMSLAVASNLGGNNDAGAIVLYLMNPPTGAQETTVTFDNAAAGGVRACSITIVELAGVDAANPLGAIATVASSTTTLAIAAEATGSIILVAATARDGDSGPFTPTPDTIALFDYANGSANFSDHAGMSGYRLGTQASTSYTMGGMPAVGGTHQAAAAVEFRAAPAAGTITGELAAREPGADATALSGLLAVHAVPGAREAGADSAAVTLSLPLAGVLVARTAGADAASIAAAVAIGGRAGASEASSDRAFLTGHVAPIGIGARLVTREAGADLATATGALALAGAWAATETAADGAIIDGSAAISGALTTRAGGVDAASFTGMVEAVGIDGHLSAGESGADAPALAGAIAVRGALATRQTGQEIAALAGTVALITALDARERGADTFAVGGKLADSGVLAGIETGLDAVSLDGTVRDTVTFRAEVEIELCRARPQAALARHTFEMALVRGQA